jgi:hypothetical protein
LTTVLVSLDFSKAYDCVPYDILLEKLATSYGFSPFAVKFMENYLNGRYPPSSPLLLYRGIQNVKP